MLNVSKIHIPGFPAKRIAFAAALVLGTSLVAMAPASAQQQPPAPDQQAQQPQDQNNEVQQILSRYGQFFRHEKYGDVWKPTQVAQGWRPYEPCHWVYNQDMKTWYFDDKTEWGNIVHHYGRWTLDAQQGWLWVPGADFGPGWVSWEMRGNEVGWAPLPPDQDAALVQTATFKNDPNLWIFVAFNTLGKGCGTGAAVPPPARVMGPAPLPAPAPIAYTGGYTGGIVGGYIPRIVINHGCYSDRRWCHWHPHWRPPHDQRPPHGDRPHGDRPHGDRPHDTNCRGSWCNPTGNNPKGGQVYCIRAPCNVPGHNANNGGRPHQMGHHFPRQQMANRFVPNQRFAPRFNQQRMMAPRMSSSRMSPSRMSAPRMAGPRMGGRSFAPRMASGPRMGGRRH